MPITFSNMLLKLKRQNLSIQVKLKKKQTTNNYN